MALVMYVCDLLAKKKVDDCNSGNSNVLLLAVWNVSYFALVVSNAERPLELEPFNCNYLNVK